MPKIRTLPWIITGSCLMWIFLPAGASCFSISSEIMLRISEQCIDECNDQESILVDQNDDLDDEEVKTGRYSICTNDWRQSGSIGSNFLTDEPNKNLQNTKFNVDDSFDFQSDRSKWTQLPKDVFSEYFYSLFNKYGRKDNVSGIFTTDLMFGPFSELQLGIRSRQHGSNLHSENAKYLAWLFVVNPFDDSLIGAELGHMDGETPENVYALYRYYFYWQDPLDIQALDFITADTLFISYQNLNENRDNTARYSVGAGRKFLGDLLETKVTVNYSGDDDLMENLSGVATLQIRY